MKLVVIIVVIVGIIAIAQLMRVYELASRLKGNREEEISYRDNKMNAMMWPVFFLALYILFGWLVFANYESMILLHPSSSEHGESVDTLLNFNWVIVIAVFFICNSLLAWFAAKYYDRPGAKAQFYAHNNKLELIWTTLPAVVMAVIIIYGLKIWNEVTDDASEDAITIELYAEQFKWTARYDGGGDGLGEANYTMVNTNNPLGLVTMPQIEMRIAELDSLIATGWANLEADSTLPDADVKEQTFKLERLQRHLNRVNDFKAKVEADTANVYAAGENDFLVQEIHIPVGKEIDFEFRSKDVIHSAYLPYFRVQMNCVPGMTTHFKFIPTRTTKEMQEDPFIIDNMKVINDARAAKGLEAVDFEYYLLCNKICGVSHFNMKLKVIVETECEYKQWFEFSNFEAGERRLDANGEPVKYDCDCECEWEDNIPTGEETSEEAAEDDAMAADSMAVEEVVMEEVVDDAPVEDAEETVTEE